MKIAGVCRSALLGAALAGATMMAVQGGTLAAEPISAPARCAAPDALAGPPDDLPHVAGVLRPGTVLNVLVVGSASTFGHSSPAPRAPAMVAFPQRMAEAIESAVPGLKVALTLRGGPGATAGEMSAIIRDELARGSFELVIWQTGSVEAVKNLPPGDFTQALVEGADAASEHSADVVLVDPQYSRFLQAHANVEPYERALEQVAAMPNVVLFHRFDLMRYWADEGQLDLERVAEADRGPTLDLLHSCIGHYLARLVLAGVRS